ncbi:hypothetical protein [Methylobacterium sp. J-068]|uniref:hypothetical protein n=1 Tax=Methylobacterium sp. J-068 TaxID=2836649 RepID=UPI001FBACB8C|nr:hypothetical protein [Methylobacterium sp. J-068]MCJ2033875.1 hypothetical protein [Methylobacterium sp. J-068]
MTKIALILASSVMLAGFTVGSASSAPRMSHHEMHRADSSIGYSGSHRARKYHTRHHARDHHRAWRRHHIRNRVMHGDPNARNPSLPGYGQQRGSTSGGPRY